MNPKSISTAIFLSSSVLLGLTACSTVDPNTPEGRAIICAESSYDEAYYGGSFYDYEVRSAVSSILRDEIDPGARISDANMQGLVNNLSVDGANSVASNFLDCMSE